MWVLVECTVPVYKCCWNVNIKCTRSPNVLAHMYRWSLEPYCSRSRGLSDVPEQLVDRKDILLVKRLFELESNAILEGQS